MQRRNVASLGNFERIEYCRGLMGDAGPTLLRASNDLILEQEGFFLLDRIRLDENDLSLNLTVYPFSEIYFTYLHLSILIQDFEFLRNSAKLRDFIFIRQSYLQKRTVVTLRNYSSILGATQKR